MNVLVANNHLSSIGGSEMYMYDLIKSLSEKRNIHVEYFTFQKGSVSEKIEQDLQVTFQSKKKYDLIIASHYPIIKKLCTFGPIIQVCHGTSHILESPCPLADFHVAVSQEISDFLTQQNIRNKTLLNGLDLATKKPIHPLNHEIKNVLSLCQSKEANETIREICQEEKWGFTAFNKHVNPTFNIEKIINQHDIVVGIGRSIYDAMACGRPGIIYDQREYNGNLADGYLEPEQFNLFSLFNCSGRYSRKILDKQSLKNEFYKYNPEDGTRLRRIAENQLNITKLTDDFLTLLENIRVRNILTKHLLSVFYYFRDKDYKTQKQ